MRFSINLRADLAKLNDAELAERFQKISQAYETAVNEPRWNNMKLSWSFRGPLRHPWFYPILSVLGGSAPGFRYYGIALGPFLGTRLGGKRAAMTDLMDQHLLLCEVRDLKDEMERRVDQRHKR